MSWQVLSEIGNRSGVFDRRFLIGTLFPVLIGILFSFIILKKEIPVDAISWLYILLTGFCLAFLLIELSPRLSWKLSLCGPKYQHYFQKNLDRLILNRLETHIADSDIDKEVLKDKLIREIPIFNQHAKEDYLSNYFIPERRYNHKQLILSETRFLLMQNILIMGILNLSLVLWLLNWPLDFIIFHRDKILSFYEPPIGIGLILICSVIITSSMIIMFYLSQSFWKHIVRSTNAPIDESLREQGIRETRMIQLLTFDNRTKEIYNIRKKSKLDFSDGLQPISKTIMEEEFKYRIRDKLLESTYNDFFQNNLEDLKISSLQASILSKELIAPFTKKTLKEKILKDSEFQSQYKNRKVEIVDFVKSEKLNKANKIGINVLLSSLVEFVVTQTTLQNAYDKGLKVLKQISSQLDGDITEQEIDLLAKIKRIRYPMPYQTEIILFTDQSFLETTLDSVKILDKIVKRRKQIDKTITFIKQESIPREFRSIFETKGKFESIATHLMMVWIPIMIILFVIYDIYPSTSYDLLGIAEQRIQTYAIIFFLIFCVLYTFFRVVNIRELIKYPYRRYYRRKYKEIISLYRNERCSIQKIVKKTDFDEGEIKRVLLNSGLVIPK